VAEATSRSQQSKPVLAKKTVGALGLENLLVIVDELEGKAECGPRLLGGVLLCSLWRMSLRGLRWHSMMNRPIKLYLDSSDYSTLSDHRRATPDHQDLLAHLRLWTAAGRVQCYFSATHLSEMAPLESTFADSAEQRADLLSELCARRALVGADVLLTAEFRSAYGLSGGTPCVYSETGDWFPGGSDDVFNLEQPNLDEQFDAVVSAEIEKMQLDRRARRKALRKAEQARKSAYRMVRENSRTASLGELLTMYPMREEDMRVIARYIAHDATRSEAQAAFLHNLRDPRWMMRWFRRSHAKLSPFLSWVRGPSRDMQETLRTLASEAADLRSRIGKSLNIRVVEEALSSAEWAKRQDDMLATIAQRVSSKLLDMPTERLPVSRIDAACPGFSTAIRSLHSAAWTATSSTPRAPKASDFPDAMHALYAPYVDVFRADSFMAPYIARFCPAGTVVVPKLLGLKPTLERLLATAN
jgi:hypothetical protein